MNTSTQSPTALTKVVTYATFAVACLLLLLHVIEPEFDPTWRMVSEYANGEYGFLMRLTFLLTAVGTFSVALMLKRIKESKLAKAAAVSFFISTVGIILAASFNQDPLTSKEMTFAGNMHAVSTLLGIPGFAIGSLLGGLWLKRQGLGAKAAVIGSLTLLSFIAMMTYLFTGITSAGMVEGTYTGIWNRIAWVAMIVDLLYLGVMLPRLVKTPKQ